MDNTQQNLDRVEDIISELEAQLGPLEKQSRGRHSAYLALRDDAARLSISTSSSSATTNRRSVWSSSAEALETAQRGAGRGGAED